MPVCSTCQQTKEFSSNQIKKNALQRKCIDCVSELSFEDKSKVLFQWLHSNKAILNVQMGKENDCRYLQSNTILHNSEISSFIPISCIMTMIDAKKCEYTKEIVKEQPFINPQTYLSLYLLQEKKKAKSSFFYPYISLLPKHYKDFAIFWNPEKMQKLNNTICETMIKMKITLFIDEFKRLSTHLITFDEFVWARTVIITRVFNCKINQEYVECLVPIADMMNHSLDPHVEWSFDDKLQGFKMLAIKPIGLNTVLTDSYGEKCNSRWFINYGFYLKNNEMFNQSSLFFDIPQTCTLSRRNFDDGFSGYDFCIQNNLFPSTKLYRFQVPIISHIITPSIEKMFAFARVQKEESKFASIENESKALQLISVAAKNSIKPLTDDPDINQIINGENQVLQFYISLQKYFDHNKYKLERKLKSHLEFKWYWKFIEADFKNGK
jgi:hypothetical protein